MELTGSKEEFRRILSEQRASERRVGLVLTMGALHEGHVSLVEAARRRCDVVAMTIFVNPLQFGETDDFAAYPRDLDRDAAIAESAGVDVVFAPDAHELYPRGRPETTVVPGLLGQVLEGASRPSHFTGVATVVTKLFSITGPCLAAFGEKDFQQLCIVRRLVVDLELPVEVLACPVVRDADGLALSSRNSRLNPSEQKAATALYRSLRSGKQSVERGEAPARAEAAMIAVLDDEPLVALDYAVCVDPVTLGPPEGDAGSVRLLIAGRVGSVRLIDNIAATRGGVIS